MMHTIIIGILPLFLFFFFNDTATTEIYTLSLHDALPIWADIGSRHLGGYLHLSTAWFPLGVRDRKSTRLNSSHLVISYAVFCLKKKRVCVYLMIGTAIVTHASTLSYLRSFAPTVVSTF